MWVIKRGHADYYYSHYDTRADLPVYTKDISKAKTYSTKKAAINNLRFGDMPIQIKTKRPQND